MLMLVTLKFLSFKYVPKYMPLVFQCMFSSFPMDTSSRPIIKSIDKFINLCLKDTFINFALYR